MNPRYTFTPTIVRDLMDVEGLTTLPPAVAERLRQQARVRSTHYSTRIEGNRLTLAEAEQVVLSGRRSKRIRTTTITRAAPTPTSRVGWLISSAAWRRSFNAWRMRCAHRLVNRQRPSRPSLSALSRYSLRNGRGSPTG